MSCDNLEDEKTELSALCIAINVASNVLSDSCAQETKSNK